MIHDPSALHGEIERTTDVCVIGSGPGGAVVARELAERGLRVIVLEAGPWLRSETSTRDNGEYMTRYIQDNGMRASFGNAFISTIQAEVVGGTSEINSAIFKRLPDKILKEWIEEYNLSDLSVEEFHEHFDVIEREMHVEPSNPDTQGPKNRLIQRGFEALGWESHPLTRATRSCEGASDCMTGCPSRAKQTISTTYIPKASDAGAEIFPLCRAKTILLHKGRAQGVIADILDPDTRKPKGQISIFSQVVVSSAGVLWSPLLLKRAGLKHPWLGHNLRFHLGVAAMATFDEITSPWVGAIQGWGSYAMLERGLVMESFWTLPSIIASRLPGIGHEWQARLKQLRHCAAIATKPRGCSSGFVFEGSNGRPSLYFYVRQPDVDEVAFGLKACIDVLFASGAREVFPGCFGLPKVLTHPDQAKPLIERRWKASDFEFAGTHVFGTCRMGGDPKLSVVDSFSESHQIRDLFVCDSSILPTGTVSNPQETIMAFSRRTALHIAERYKPS